MRGFHRLELEEFGLSSPEAQVYLALLRSTGGLGASAVANTTGIQRTGIYPILDFDRQSVLMPLVAPSGQGGTLFIRHPQVAMSLGMLFDSFWERGKPFPAKPRKKNQGQGGNQNRSCDFEAPVNTETPIYQLPTAFSRTEGPFRNKRLTPSKIEVRESQST